MNTATNVETRFNEALADFVASGCVWSATTGLAATMTAGVAYINGKRVVVATVSTRTFTASKDTYVSVDENGAIGYSEVANGASQPSLPSNSIWLARVVTNGSAVTSVAILHTDNGQGAWRSYTPTFSNVTVGNGTLTAKWTQVGKTVFGRVTLVFGSTTSVAGDIQFTLPSLAASFTGSSAVPPIGTGRMFDTSASLVAHGSVVMFSTSTAALRPMTASANYVTQDLAAAGTPFTWATGDEINTVFTYEAA